MEVIIIDQNKGDRFLIRYLLENQPGITSSLECKSPSEAEHYLRGMANVNSHERFVILCNETVGPVDGLQSLKTLRSAFPHMDLFTVLMQENSQGRTPGLDLSQVDERMEKKIELQEFGEEVGRIIVAAGRGSNRIRQGNSKGFQQNDQGPYLAFSSLEKARKRRFPVWNSIFYVALN